METESLLMERLLSPRTSSDAGSQQLELTHHMESEGMVVPPVHGFVPGCSAMGTESPSSPDTGSGDVVMLPSIGSMGHNRGLCRPCGFVHSRNGCSSGASCKFCHLCPVGSIERQRKMKRHLVKAAQK